MQDYKEFHNCLNHDLLGLRDYQDSVPPVTTNESSKFRKLTN